MTVRKMCAGLLIAASVVAGKNVFGQTPKKCGGPAAPNVNWSGCSFGGVMFDNNGLPLPATILRGANLSGAIFRPAGGNVAHQNGGGGQQNGADFSFANLSNANLRGADLAHASLSNANLTNAILADAVLRNSNLTDANLSNAHLEGAVLSGVISDRIVGIPAALPPGWTLVRGKLIQR
jgi:uncharacterized protein YjbI with pentapeptide repeats